MVRPSYPLTAPVPAEILEFGNYGTLVPLADVEALAQAILSTLTCAKDSEVLQRRAEKFSLETAVDCYLELLNLDSVHQSVTLNTLDKIQLKPSGSHCS